MTKNNSKKSSKYPFLWHLIQSWKPRAKKIKLNLKDLAPLAGVATPHLTKIICGNVANPRLKTINDIEMALRAREENAK